MRAHRSRVRRLTAGFLGLLALGLGYAALVRLTGRAVPCLFRAATGWRCPGCGVTHMCLALLRLDLPAAWASNPGLMLLLAPLGALLAVAAARYVRTGAWRGGPGESVCAWAMTAYLLGYGLLRNITGW